MRFVTITMLLSSWSTSSTNLYFQKSNKCFSICFTVTGTKITAISNIQLRCLLCFLTHYVLTWYVEAFRWLLQNKALNNLCLHLYPRVRKEMHFFFIDREENWETDLTENVKLLCHDDLMYDNHGEYILNFFFQSYFYYCCYMSCLSVKES